MVIPSLLFVVSAGAIVFAGTKLSRHGDQIAELTGLGRLWIGVVLMAAATIVLLIAAPVLAWSAERIAEESGITATFIGKSLVAMMTSLPELVVSISAVRLGAFDLAVGNLLGSNAFNMAAFFFADLAYGGGGLLSTVSSTHALTALWSIIMMNIGLMGIIYRAERRFMLIEPDSLLMIVCYVLGLWLLFNG